MPGAQTDKGKAAPTEASPDSGKQTAVPNPPGVGAAPALEGSVASNGTIDFVTDPPGARIFVFGRQAPKVTPAHSKFPPGDYPIELRMEGYKTYQATVHIDAGGAQTVKKVLEPQ